MLDHIKDFFGNYLLMSAALGWLGAQICKVFTGMFKERKFDFAKWQNRISFRTKSKGMCRILRFNRKTRYIFSYCIRGY